MNFCFMGKGVFLHCDCSSEAPTEEFLLYGEKLLLYITIINSPGELTEEFLLYVKDVFLDYYHYLEAPTEDLLLFGKNVLIFKL